MGTIEERLTALETKLAEVQKDFLEHWKWHRGRQQLIQKAGAQFQVRLGINYVLANNRANARRGAFVYGPNPDLIALRELPVEDGYVLVLSSPDGPSKIVSEYKNGTWVEIPNEVLASTAPD
jgi:hypothetical protein